MLLVRLVGHFVSRALKEESLSEGHGGTSDSTAIPPGRSVSQISNYLTLSQASRYEVCGPLGQGQSLEGPQQQPPKTGSSTVIIRCTEQYETETSNMDSIYFGPNEAVAHLVQPYCWKNNWVWKFESVCSIRQLAAHHFETAYVQ